MVYEFPARVSTAGILLDRDWGGAPQPHTSDDGEDIRITTPAPGADSSYVEGRLKPLGTNASPHFVENMGKFSWHQTWHQTRHQTGGTRDDVVCHPHPGDR